MEAVDLEQLEWLWDLVPEDLPRLSRCVRAFERRYPRSDRLPEFRRRLGILRRRRLRRRLSIAAVAAGLIAVGLAGYDAWGYRRALAFERDHPAPAVLRHWETFLAWHPSHSWFWPRDAKQARLKLAEWKVQAAQLQADLGTAGPELRTEMGRLKEEAPHLAAPILQVESTLDRRRHDQTWKEMQAAALLADDRPEEQLAAVRTFLRDFPETPHAAAALKLATALEGRAADRRASLERQELDALARAGGLPDPDLRDLIDRAQKFLELHPESRLRAEAAALLEGYVARLDERDIEKARQYSRQYPTNFQTRIDRYQDYLKAHAEGGRSISEAMEAIDQIERQRDAYLYRLAYDHLVAHPDDVAEVARRFRDYLAAVPDGRYRRDAEAYLKWWERVTVPHGYKVTLRRGEVDPAFGKYLAGGAPNLGVEVWVAGVKHGPSPVVRNTHRPIWDYTFPRPITWKLNDPVVVKIIDYDWSDTEVSVLKSRAGDPLAIRNLSGTIKRAKGGQTTLVFASDFQMPALTKPE